MISWALIDCNVGGCILGFYKNRVCGYYKDNNNNRIIVNFGPYIEGGRIGL